MGDKNNRLNRRHLLELSGLTAVGALAGCLDGESTPAETPDETDTPTPSSTPAENFGANGRVHYPLHTHKMIMAGTQTVDDFSFAVMYSVPDYFWNVNGTSVQKTLRRPTDDVHMMTVVWDEESEQVLPETGLSIQILKEGEMVSQEVIYPMLSQRMGFHYGANFGMDGDGEYTIKATVGGISTRRTRSFSERFDSGETAEITFDYSQQEVDDITLNKLDKAGELGGVGQMDMMMTPEATAADPAELPGQVVGTGSSGDAELVLARVAPADSPVETDSQYLSLTARTPYNKIVIPAMLVDATITRDGETVFEGTMERTLDPERGYHYGAEQSVRQGDVVTLSFPTPPQTARHDGYESAFLNMENIEITVGDASE